jgi:hypothetical protein
VRQPRVQVSLAPPTFQSLRRRLDGLKAEQSRLLPPPGLCRLVEPAGVRKPTPDQQRRLRELELRIDKVTMALNDYCRRHGEPDWY